MSVTCPQKGWLPFVTSDDKGNLKVPLTCSQSLKLSVDNYVPYKWSTQQFSKTRLFMKCLNWKGETINLSDVGRYVVCPQGFDIVGIVSVLFQIGDYRYENGVGVTPAIFDGISPDTGTYWQYILRVKDPLGNDHFCYSSGLSSITPGNAQTMLPQFGKNIILTNSINVGGIFGYSVLSLPQEPIRNFKWMFNQYATDTHREKPTGSIGKRTFTDGGDINPFSDRGVGGYLTLNTQLSAAVQVPSDMQMIGIGCQAGCKDVVLIVGYKYDTNDFLFPDGDNKYRMLDFVTQKYDQNTVINNLKLMFKWVLSSEIDQYYKEDQIKIIKNKVNKFISGMYALYGVTNSFQGKMDDYFDKFCEDNPQHILCGCYDATSTVPPCYNQACQRGYMPLFAQNQKCDKYVEANSINEMLKQNQASIDKQMTSIQDTLQSTNTQMVNTLKDTNASMSNTLTNINNKMTDTLQSTSTKTMKNFEAGFQKYQTDTQQVIDSHLDNMQTEIQTGLTNIQQSVNTNLGDTKAQIQTGLTNIQQSVNTDLNDAKTELIKQDGDANDKMLQSSQQFYTKFQETLDGLQSQIIKYVDDSVIIQEISKNSKELQMAVVEDRRILDDIQTKLQKQKTLFIVLFIMLTIVIGACIFVIINIIKTYKK